MTKMASALMVKPLTKVHPLTRRATTSLEDIVKKCSETEATWGLLQNDLVFAVAFWSMVECGFESFERKSVKDQGEFTLPDNWKHKTRQIYEAQFVLPPYANNTVKLIALPADDVLCINLLASNISPRNVNLRSLAIHSSGFVPRPEETAFKYKFAGLDEFHLLLKDSVIWPIRCAILSDQGVMNGSLCGLSDEIKLKIVSHLSFKEILMLSQTCHDLNRICNDQGLWKLIFHEAFKSKCKCSASTKECGEDLDWKENYKKIYSHKEAKSAGSENSPSESYHTAQDVLFGSDIDFDID